MLPALHVRLFGTAGGDSLQLKARWLQPAVPALATVWLIMVIWMMHSTHIHISSALDVFVYVLSAILIFAQFTLIFFSFRSQTERGQHRTFVIKRNIASAQLVLQTFLGLSTLTAFVFRTNGLSFVKCLFSSSCGTMRFERRDIDVLYATLVLYIIAVSTVIVHIREYTRILPPRDGDPTHVVPPRKRMLLATQVLPCAYCSIFLFMAVLEFLWHGYSTCAFPFAVGLFLMGELSGKFFGTRPSWQQFHEIDRHMFNYQACMVHDIMVIVWFSYLAGLSAVNTILRAARISTMPKEYLPILLCGVLSHVFVSLGYFQSVKVHSSLMRQEWVDWHMQDFFRMARANQHMQAHIRSQQLAPSTPPAAQCKYCQAAHCEYCKQTKPDGPNETRGDCPTECWVCRDKQRGYIALPCGHFALCGDCKDKVGNLCPFCRKQVHEWFPVLNPC